MPTTFDPTTFKQDYPQFNNYSDNYLTGVYDNEALVLGAKVISLFTDENAQLYWAQVVLAHILTISGGQDDSGTAISGSGITGRIDAATTGSVTASSTNMDTLSSTWWAQTIYGQKIWQLFRQRGGATYISSCYNWYYTDLIFN